MCTVHEGEGPRLPSALLKERCAYSPSQVESQVAKPFSMLACLMSTLSIATMRHIEVWTSVGDRIRIRCLDSVVGEGTLALGLPPYSRMTFLLAFQSSD